MLTSSARDGLVEHDQLRLQCQSAGHTDALTLAARELVREALGVIRGKTDQLEQLGHALAVVAIDLVHLQRLRDGIADSQARVERCVRILEHHLHLLAQRLQLLA